MDIFKELSPEEVKLTTLQFIGQNLAGPLKELDNFIVTKNSTLQGKTIDPVRVLKTIPTEQTSPPLATVVNAGINVSRPINTVPQAGDDIEYKKVSQQNNILSQHDSQQLEFDFDKRAKYSDILDALNDIKSRLFRIEQRFDSKD